MISARRSAALVAVIALAALVRFFRLGFEGLWSDEGYTAQIVALPLGEMLRQLVRFDDAPPLFYLLEKLTVLIGGRSESPLRFLPAMAGLLCVPILWRNGSSERRWSAVLAAVFCYAIFHSRQARSYSLLILLALVLVLAACDLLVHGRRSWSWLVLSSSLIGMTHHVGILMVASSLVLWPLGSASRPSFGKWVAGHLPAFVIYGLLWSFAGAQFEVHEQLNAWTARYWEQRSLWTAPVYSLASYLPLGLPASELSVPIATSRSVSVVWTAVSLLLGLVCLLFAMRSSLGRSTATRVEIGFVLVPLVLLVAASLVVTPVYVLGRTDVLAFPAFLLLLGRGLASFRRRWAVATVGIWAALSASALGPGYGVGSSEWVKGSDRELAVRLVEAGLEPNDWVVHTFMTSPSLEYYLERAGAQHHAAWFPKVARTNTASVFPTPADSLEAYVREATSLRTQMEVTANSTTLDFDVWVLGLVVAPAADVVRRARGTNEIEVRDLAYPGVVLVHSLVADQPVGAVTFYRQDWVAGERVVVRIPYRQWAAPSEVHSIPIVVKNEKGRGG